MSTWSSDEATCRIDGRGETGKKLSATPGGSPACSTRVTATAELLTAVITYQAEPSYCTGALDDGCSTSCRSSTGLRSAKSIAFALFLIAACGSGDGPGAAAAARETAAATMQATAKIRRFITGGCIPANRKSEAGP